MKANIRAGAEEILPRIQPGAVVVSSTLIVGASYGLGTVLMAFGAMVALSAITVMRITIEPDQRQKFTPSNP